MARSEIQAAVVESIRKSLPKRFGLRGGPRQRFYKAGVYTLNLEGGTFWIARLILWPDGRLNCTLNQGVKVNRKVPYPQRELKVELAQPDSIEIIENWFKTFTGIKLPWESPPKPSPGSKQHISKESSDED